MGKSLKTIAASILALIIASPAFGKTPYPGFERDMALAFENDGEPMELALLSEKEMRETEGAFTWPGWIVRSFIGGGSYGVGYGVYNHGAYRWNGASEWMMRGGAFGTIVGAPHGKFCNCSFGHLYPVPRGIGRAAKPNSKLCCEWAVLLDAMKAKTAFFYLSN